MIDSDLKSPLMVYCGYSYSTFYHVVHIATRPLESPGILIYPYSHPLLNMNFYNVISYNVKIFSATWSLLKRDFMI